LRTMFILTASDTKSLKKSLKKCKMQNETLSVKELVFDYTNAGIKISIIEPLVGNSGWLTLKKLTINAFEQEDYLLFAGYADNGASLDEEQCKRLFNLPATINDINTMADNVRLEQSLECLRVNISENISKRNSELFDEEMTKLDKWAEDKKNSLEIELKQLDKDIKTKKTEVKKILKLEDKVAAQKEIKEMEAKRNKMRLDLFNSQDLVDKQKEELIEKIEVNLRQQIYEDEIFMIKWKVV